MRHKYLMPAFVGFTVLLFACDRVASKHEGDAPVDTAALAKSIEAQEAEILAAFKAKDGAKVASHYADDAVVATPGRAAGRGKAAIAAMMAEDFKDPAFSLDFTNEKTAVAASGDMAYTRGTFRVAYTNPQSKKVENAAGSYVTVFRKQADGSWQVVEDLSTPGAPPAS